MRNPDVITLVYELDLAIDEIVAFGKAKGSEIQERKRRLIKIRDDLKARNESDQLEMFDRAESLEPDVESIIKDPTKGW